jgi:hypothetical protein
MKIKELIESLESCDPEAMVFLSLEFKRKNLDPERICSDHFGAYAAVPLESHANSIGDRIEVDNNGPVVILESSAGNISDVDNSD